MDATSLGFVSPPALADPGPDNESDPITHRLFQCSTCKRSFTRADHLTRHVRAHTRQRPYVCPVCTKGFARVDLLKRHAVNHESGGSSCAHRSIPRASRVVQACEACSQHHLRCDNKKPCSRCRKKNIVCRVPADSSADLDAARDLLDLCSNVGPSSSIVQEQNGLLEEDQTESLVQRIEDSEYSYSTPQPGYQALDENMQSDTEDVIMRRSFASDTVLPLDGLVSLDNGLPDFLRNMPLFESCVSGNATPRGIMDMGFDWDLNLNDLDIGFLDQYSLHIPFNAETPSTSTAEPASIEQLAPALPRDDVVVRHEAFKKSVWRYLPRSDRDFGAAEEDNLAFVDAEGYATKRSQLASRRVVQERLSRVMRDRLLALVLTTCKPSNVSRIASAFPSVDLLDGLIQYFLTSPAVDARSWLHLPTFSPSGLKPELLASIIAAGAVSTPDLPLRKLGFALHEAARVGQSRNFESDNSSIRDLQSVQSLLLQLEIGIWSGISRKMEIAESFLQPLVTMIRRGGRFRASMWKDITPVMGDEGTALEDKWKEWVHQETYLRLIYRIFKHDRQSSMALLKPPLISYSEMQLPLPHPDELWHANNATIWKGLYTSQSMTATRKRPVPADCLLDLDHFQDYQHASSAYLYMTWGMIWEYTQMSSLCLTTPLQSHNSLVLPSRHQELIRLLENYRISNHTKETNIMLEILFCHLNAHIQNIQLFAGIEGQEEARRVFPNLKEWVLTSSARQTLWHTGQILRTANNLPRGQLRDFNAIAVYHAGLIMWVYGFIKRSISPSLSIDAAQPVLLDGEQTADVRRFITLDRGVPVIQLNQPENRYVYVGNVIGVLDALMHLLRNNHDGGEGSLPPLVDNLIQLIAGLRSATE